MNTGIICSRLSKVIVSGYIRSHFKYHPMLSQSEKINVVRTFWQNFLDCSDEHFDQKKTSVFLHNKDASDPIDNENEIYIFELHGGGTVVSVSAKMFERVSVILQTPCAEVEWQIRSEIEIVQKHGPQLGYYQFNTPTFPVSPNVRYLTVSDASLYENFMNTCDSKERKMVGMDFANPYHTFFAYIQDGKILSLGNYMHDDDTDMLAHIGIITLPEAKGKWYATQVIQTLLNDTSAKWFVPQWRAHIDNHVSQKMAQDFGFELLLNSYSLITA